MLLQLLVYSVVETAPSRSNLIADEQISHFLCLLLSPHLWLPRAPAFFRKITANCRVNFRRGFFFLSGTILDNGRNDELECIF